MFLFSCLTAFVPDSQSFESCPIPLRCSRLSTLSNSLGEEPAVLKMGELLSIDNSQMKKGQESGLFLVLLDLVQDFMRLYSDVSSLHEILSYFKRVVEALQSVELSQPIQDGVEKILKNLTATMSSSLLKRRPLEFLKRKPMAIKSFTPAFREHYSVDKRYSSNPELAEMAKLKYQHKKEFRGAVRELRKDAEFLAQEKLKEIKIKDAEYKKKMDKIMGDLANQEGAMRGYEKEKKKSRTKF
jgi:nucleolar protein 14